METSHLKFIEDLPYTISVPIYNVIVVHASLDPLLPLAEQKKELLMSIKHRSIHVADKENDQEHNVTHYKNITQHSITAGWAASWNRSELVVFGHDSIRGLQLYDNALGIDTGCIYGNSLTGVLITKVHRGNATEDNELISTVSPSVCNPKRKTI